MYEGALEEEDDGFELADFSEDFEEDEDDSDDCVLEGVCEDWLDWVDKQSVGQAFGFAFSNSSQILSPHLPIFSIGGLGSVGAGF